MRRIEISERKRVPGQRVAGGRRAFSLVVALCALLALAAPAALADDDEEEAGWDSEEYYQANHFGLGFNGLITAAIDPFWMAVQPPEGIDDLIGAPVTNHAAGFFAGTLLMGYRVLGGAADMALALFPHATLSPEPRVNIFYGLVEHPEI